MLHEFSVHWSWNQPYLNPIDSFYWKPEIRFAVEGDLAKDASLGWPAGTQECLRLAFSQRLGRQTSWCFDNIETVELINALKKAASIYKRGVHWSHGEAHASPNTERGSYVIQVPPQETPLCDVLDLVKHPNSFVVIDRQVDANWYLASRFPGAFVIDVTEATKTLDTISIILERARRVSAGHWLIIGGGILGDVAAFAASQCGASFCFMPTTLLAMADACIGGKTGVNFPPFGKNQVGAFAFPDQVIAWVGWLKTLPARELLAGGAECLKHGFLSGDRSLITRITSALSDASIASIVGLLPDIIRIKADIITKDPNEAGVRAILNLGHTLAHALESISQDRQRGSAGIIHGEAVAVGLVTACIISRRICHLPAEELALVITSLTDAGCLPSTAQLESYLAVSDLSSPELIAELLKYIGHDKKNNSGQASSSRWVLLNRLGETAIGPAGESTMEVDDETISLAWREVVNILGH